ncbi:MAG TPA: hypothetical protein VGQ62_10275 [Chloroflexota bacterium]|nr:hypothetical protein [Chloroflexota bacterium]
MNTDTVLLDVQTTLTPAEHQTHRRYPFDVPPGCQKLAIEVRYAPKFLSTEESIVLASQAVGAQARTLAERIGPAEAAQWTADQGRPTTNMRIPNLLTISVDDAAGKLRGAGHRHAAEQTLFVGLAEASPGFVAGPLPDGIWWLTLSAHTVVSSHCEVSIVIQMGAESASSLS